MATSVIRKTSSLFGLALACLAVAACSSSTATPDPGTAGGNGNTGPGGGEGNSNPTCGASQTKLVATEKPISALAQDDTSLFYSVQSTGIFKLAKSGGEPIQIAQTKSAFPTLAMAADATSVYFHDGNAIYKVAKDGKSAPAKVVDVETFAGFTLDGTSLYAADQGPILSEREDKPAAGKILKIDVAGSTAAVELATGQREPGEPATDGDAVYWYNRGAESADYKSKHDGALMRVAKGGGSPKALFQEDILKPGRRGLSALFVDSASLYYGSLYVPEKLSESEGGFYRLAKDGSGEPTKFSPEVALARSAGFLEGDTFYVASGAYVGKFAKSGGDTTKVACFKDPSSGAIHLVGDSKSLYFIRLASPGSEIGSVPR